MGANESAKPHKTLEAAAKAYGAAHGVTGKAGGWLYRNGTHLCHGWRSYGYRLVSAGIIDPQDETGRSVRRIGHLTTASERQWRANARQYVITEGEK